MILVMGNCKLELRGVCICVFVYGKRGGFGSLEEHSSM